MLVNKQNW